MVRRLALITIAMLVFLGAFSATLAAQSDRLFYNVSSTNDLRVWGSRSLTEKVVGRLNFPDVLGLAYDVRANVLYGVTKKCEVVRVHPLTARAEKIKAIEVDGAAYCQAIAVDSSGEGSAIYVANALGDRKLYRIQLPDSVPPTVTVIGGTVTQVTGMAFSPKDGVLYGINRDRNALGILNKGTGEFVNTFENAGINNPDNISFDHVTGELLGVFHPNVIGRYDLANGRATKVGDIGTSTAFAITPDFYRSPRPLIVGEEVDATFESSHPYGDGILPPEEVVTVMTIRREGAAYIAPYFRKFELDPGDFVIVRNPENTRSWKYEGFGVRDLGKSTGFWGIHIPGEVAIIELHRRGAGDAYGVLIDKFARGFSSSETNAYGGNQGLNSETGLCGNDDFEDPICLASKDLKAYSRTVPVARLLLNGTSSCTGFLFGNQGHILTNNHCIGTSSDATVSSIEMKAEGGSCSGACKTVNGCPGIIEAASTTFVKTSAAHDYTLVQPDTLVNLSLKYGYLQARASGPILGEKLYIPGHPAGWGKQVAYISTEAGDNGTPRVITEGDDACWPLPPNNTKLQDIGYRADSLGGSSGSPVIAKSDHLVIALHHCGSVQGPCVNGGVPIDLVVNDLGALRPNCSLSTDPNCSGSGLPNFSGDECQPCQSDLNCLFGFKCVSGQCISSQYSGYGGESCCNGLQCRSSVCAPDMRCVCETDDHCPAGKRCRSDATGKKSCQDAAVGPDAECDSCLSDSECQSGDCYHTRCVTRGVLGIGAQCCRNVQCISRSCRNGTCQCRKNSDCGDGYYCKKTPLALNLPNECRVNTGYCGRCSTDKECGPGSRCDGKPVGRCVVSGSAERSIGDECCRNVQCASNNCSNKTDTCACTKDSHCDPGKYCKNGPLGIGDNKCVDRKNECSACTGDSECKSGAQCKFFKCQTKSKEVGQDCCGDYQCKSGSCNVSGKCQCAENSDCPHGQYCAKGFLGVGKNSCRSYIAECDLCSKDSQCGPAATCKFFRCATKDSLGKGASCCRDYQCKSGKCRITGKCG